MKILRIFPILAAIVLLPTFQSASAAQPAPSWELRDIDGKPVTSADFKGKVVVIDFWATWCPPCIEEIPGYVQLQDKYGSEGVVIVGVSLDRGGPGVVRSFAERYGINYPLVMGTPEVAQAFGGIQYIPTTFIIDREGNIAYTKTGYEPTAEFEKQLLAVLR